MKRMYYSKKKRASSLESSFLYRYSYGTSQNRMIFPRELLFRLKIKSHESIQTYLVAQGRGKEKNNGHSKYPR